MRTQLLVAAGAALLAAGGAIRFVAAPALVQLPADLDTTVQLTGTTSMLNQSAIQSGDIFHALSLGMPITITNRVWVTATQGETAVVANRSTVTGPGGEVISVTQHSWAVNRKTMEEAPAPPGSSVSPHHGLVVGFPLTPEPHDYPYWDFPTQTTVTARYQGERSFDGHQVYVYSVHASGVITDPEILKTVPKTIPLELIATSDSTFYVDPATSVVYDVAQRQVTQAKVKLSLLTLPPITVSTLEAHFSVDTANSVVAQANTAGQQLYLLRTGVPGGMALLGLALAGYPFVGRTALAKIRERRRGREITGTSLIVAADEIQDRHRLALEDATRTPASGLGLPVRRSDRSQGDR
jgi:hypothetical protein